jgi:hypothetical protein
MPLLSTDVYPPSYIIREGIIERLKTIATFQSVKLFSRNRGKGPYQAENIPLVACYRMSEALSPDGDANHGEPRFTHDVKYGFSVVVQNNDNAAAEASVMAGMWTILRTLENQRWWHFPVEGEWQRNPFTKKIEPLKIESYTRGEIRPVNFGPKAGNNEVPYAELDFELTARFRSGFPPYVPDPLELVHVTVAYPWPFDPNANDGFYVAYDMTSSDNLPVDSPFPPVWPVIP